MRQSPISDPLFDQARFRATKLARTCGYLKANWIGADVREMDFAGALMVRRVILDQNYLDEFRRRDAWHAFVYLVWKMSCDCGRSLSRWLALVLVGGVIFGGIYTQLGVDFGDHPTALSPLYFSFVTFTTLGFGDVVPTGTWAQLAVMIEVSFGYMGLGGLLSILSCKMTRRAE